MSPLSCNVPPLLLQFLPSPFELARGQVLGDAVHKLDGVTASNVSPLLLNLQGHLAQVLGDAVYELDGVTLLLMSPLSF